jgi:hypothetical protein
MQKIKDKLIIDTVIIDGISKNVVKIIWQPKIKKTVLFLDDGTKAHLECNAILSLAGGNWSGNRLCRKYICRVCRSSFTNVEEPFLAKDKKCN